jgi:succinate dehydrogenase/fumarate reductase flavoprotein subunit
MQRLHSPRGTTLYLGNALAARLYRSVLDLGVEIRLGVCVDRLTLEGGQLVGVETSSAQGRESLSATRGVILATGGISHDDGLRQRYVPLHAAPLSATVGAQGSSGASLALQVGARMREPHTSGAFWVPGSTFKRSDGTTGVYPHTVTDRAKPGLIAVDSTGKRFTNEAVSYHDFGLAQLNAPVNAIPAHLICDRRFLWKYGLGRIKPFSIKRKKYIDSGYLKCAPTLAGLGDHLGIPADNLESTVANFNAEAARGVDSVFGRGGNIYQRHMGDADHQPNPCVAALDAPPYYAVSVVPTDLGMAAGIITDSNARVINTAGDVIPGLYACGKDMVSLMAGAFRGPGITLGPALTFAFIAAKHAANR